MKRILFLFFVFIIFSCQTEENPADIVFINGTIATVDEKNPQIEAIAVKDDRIMEVGTGEAIKKLIGEKTEVVDLKGNFAMPGFIEGHGHFSSLGSSLQNLNFLKSKSWDEIVAMVEEKVKTAKPGEWITGRGWHQEKWTTPLDKQVLGYPYHDKLSAISPNNPIVLRHASGHGLFANEKAMQVAGVTAETPNPMGGEIVRDSRGEAIGVFEERATSVINAALNEYMATLSEEDRKRKWLEGIELAEQECLKKGVTSFQDAGASFTELSRYKGLAETGKLDVRLWTMIRHSYDMMKNNLGDYPVIGAGNHFFTARAIKSEVDGALGAFGAWLLEPYQDKPNFVGQNTTPIEEVKNIAGLAAKHDLQLCVHAIGDRANREVLDIFEETLKPILANPTFAGE